LPLNPIALTGGPLLGHLLRRKAGGDGNGRQGIDILVGWVIGLSTQKWRIVAG
jgi:hypothetical protein